MIQSLITSLLQISAVNWTSAVLLDSDSEGVKVFNTRATQGANHTRYVVFNVLEVNPAYRHHIGTAATVAVQDEGTVQFDIYAETDYEAAVIGANLRSLLEGKYGVSSGINYNTIIMTGQRTGYIDGQRYGTFSQDYQIRINL